jgi:hypothetical protein
LCALVVCVFNFTRSPSHHAAMYTAVCIALCLVVTVCGQYAPENATITNGLAKKCECGFV